MKTKHVCILTVVMFALLQFNLLQAKTKVVIPPGGTDIIVCTTDENGVTVCL